MGIEEKGGDGGTGQLIEKKKALTPSVHVLSKFSTPFPPFLGRLAHLADSIGFSRSPVHLTSVLDRAFQRHDVSFRFR